MGILQPNKPTPGAAAAVMTYEVVGTNIYLYKQSLNIGQNAAKTRCDEEMEMATFIIR